MPGNLQKITPFLWFDTEAEEAAQYYVSIFPDSRVTETSRYDENASKAAGRPAGSVMTVAFELIGQEFVALNGGPHFRFSEAVSFIVNCDSQAEIDRYWTQLSSGGDPNSQQCGWLKDKYGLSWQIVPARLSEYIGDRDSRKAGRAMQALLKMKKIDIAALEAARDRI